MTDSSKPDMTAKLREALGFFHRDGNTDLYWNRINSAAWEYLALLESGSIVITKDAEGNWPEALYEAIEDVEVLSFDGRGHTGDFLPEAAQVIRPEELDRILDAILAHQALADSQRGDDGSIPSFNQVKGEV